MNLDLAAAQAAARNELATLEREAEEELLLGMNHMARFAEILLKIHDQDLYLETHDSWAAYVEDRWKRKRRWAYQMIDWAKVRGELCAFAHTLPEQESQARPLVPLPPEQRRVVWEGAVEAAGGQQPKPSDLQERARLALEGLPDSVKGRMAERDRQVREARAEQERLRAEAQALEEERRGEGREHADHKAAEHLRNARRHGRNGSFPDDPRWAAVEGLLARAEGREG